jgi:hypothetical protein
MLYDKNNLYCDAVSVSTSAATHTALIGDVVDHGPLASGNSTHNLHLNNLWLNIRVTTELVSTNVGTLAIAMYTADNTAMTNSALIFTAVPAAVASVGYTAGKEYSLQLPKADYKRYTQLHITGAAHIITAGAITAVLSDTPGEYDAYAQDASIY